MTGQLAFDLPSRTAQGRDDFLVAAPNADAVAWLDRWPDWPGQALCVHGPAGCGKSHLIEVWRTRSRARDLVLPADLGAAVAAGAVALDDADRAGDEVALFHALNAVREGGGSLLLTAQAPPARWPLSLPDLRSRLAAIPAVAVAPPDDALLAALLVKQFGDRQLQVPSDVVDYLAARLDRTFEAVRAVVGALDRASLAQRRPITVPLARQVLAELS